MTQTPFQRRVNGTLHAARSEAERAFHIRMTIYCKGHFGATPKTDRCPFEIACGSIEIYRFHILEVG